MADEKIEEKATPQEAATETIIENSEQDASQESHDKPDDASDKTEQDAVEEGKRQAQSDFDKQTALLDKFNKSPVIKDRLQEMVDIAVTEDNARKAVSTSQTTTDNNPGDAEDVVTKADLLKFQQNMQGFLANAVEAPQQRTAMAEMGSFLDESIKAGSITEEDRKRVQSIIQVFDPNTSIRLGWDEVSGIAKELIQGKAAMNILSKMKVSSTTTTQKKQEAMKDVAQPDSASTAQPGKEKDSPEDKTLAEFRKFHDNKSIFAK